MSAKEVYIRIWRTAFERDSLELRYATKAQAVRMRLNLYRAVAPYRDDPSLDPGFTRIIEQLEMVIAPFSDGFALTLRNKSLNPLLIEASRQLDSLTGE
jgi:hypothetical protein